ncbi:MAG: hypothetical protein IKE94_04830 [Aeriscardovia sp.]|nr:hypothetical protein [Aeriscardovia sp.]
MQTKYTTGQAVLIPATITSAREENGTIIYDVESRHWEGVPENAIVIDNEAAARAAFDNAMRSLSERMAARY